MSDLTFDINEGIEILARTPSTLTAWLGGLPERLIHDGAADGGWSPFDVLGHLIHGEKTDWLPRARIILEQGEGREFEPFDRFAQLKESHGRSLSELLDEFERLRSSNLDELRALAATGPEMSARGRHPELGAVTLGQLLATWVVHDLNHLAQIARVLAGRYSDAVGPWGQYLPILE